MVNPLKCSSGLALKTWLIYVPAPRLLVRHRPPGKAAKYFTESWRRILLGGNITWNLKINSLRKELDPKVDKTCKAKNFSANIESVTLSNEIILFCKKAQGPEEEGGSYICRCFKHKRGNLWSNLCRKDLTQEHFAPLLQSHQIFLAWRLKI